MIAVVGLGTDVRRLARAYMGTAEAVVGMMARAPSVPGKTRLGRSTEALRRALFLDAWDVVASGAWDVALVFMPSESADECAALVRPAGGTPLLVPQSGGDLGERMSAALRAVRNSVAGRRLSRRKSSAASEGATPDELTR